MKTSIIINNLTKKFGDVVAIDNVSLRIEPGSFLTLLGPSGCGKTTLLRCIAGLEEPDGGEIYIGDKLVFSYDKGISLPAGQRDLGLVFQNYALWPHMKVNKNITFALEIKKMTKNEMQERVKEALAEVQMEGYEDRYPREMSGGQQQRIVIARAMLREPKLIVADEPVSMLDASVRVEILKLMRALQESHGLSVIYITHDLSTVRYFCERVLVMYAGKIIEDAPVADLVRTPLQGGGPFAVAFQAAAAGLGPSVDVDAVHVEPSAALLLSTDAPFRAAGVWWSASWVHAPGMASTCVGRVTPVSLGEHPTTASDMATDSPLVRWNDASGGANGALHPGA